jgi:ribosomal protein S18 acetylase RimI-like enzyme
MCKVSLTIAVPADLEPIARLVNDAYRGSTKTPGWTHEVTLLAGQRIDVATLRATIEQAGATILVMRKDGDIVGCVALQAVEPHEWYLSMLAVDPDRQDGGLGKAIMAGAERFARERGAQQIRISVIDQRMSLIVWYERMGYVRTGASEPFPDDDSTVGTPLRGDLSLIALVKSLRSEA